MRVASLLHACMAACTASALAGPWEVTCESVPIPGLQAKWSENRKAWVCVPSTRGSAPLHLFAHADLGGGPMALAYLRVLKQIASFGFVVAEYVSCVIDSECDNGESQFLDLLRTASYLEAHPTWAPKIDFTKSYSISGHSTGARAVLMLAALRDTPQYLLNDSAIYPLLTPQLRQPLMRIASVVSDHPDDMYNPVFNPDLPHYRITRTPVMILTGSRDTIEPNRSAWKDFLMIEGGNKVFVDVLGADHSEPIEHHRGGPFIALFSQVFALGNTTAAPYIYGMGPGSIRAVLPIAGPGQPNTGGSPPTTFGYLACREMNGTVVSIPPEQRAFCPL